MPLSNTLTIRHCLEQDFGMPQFRDDNVLFFANLKSLFLGNTEQTRELMDLVGELNSYGGRLIPMLDLMYHGGQNTLVLEQLPDVSLLNYFSRTLGLSLPEIHVMSMKEFQEPTDGIVQALKSQIQGNPAAIDGYVTDQTLHKWSQRLGLHHDCSEEGYRIGNNKTSLHRYLEAHDLSIPDTYVSQTAGEVTGALQNLKKRGYRRAVVRAAIGASGIGMVHVNFEDPEFPELPENYFHAGPCLVQGWLQPGVMGVKDVTSPSVQFFVGETHLELFDITSQILSGNSVHEGNYSPPTAYNLLTLEEIVREAKRVAVWLHKVGYRGPGSVDFIVVETIDGGKQPFVCEVNARVTGATYPSVLAKQFAPEGAWLMRNLRFESDIKGQEILAMLEQSKWLFHAGDSSGVIPINFNSRSGGKVAKGQFLCLSDSIEACSDLLERVVNGLPVRTVIERD